MSVEWRCYKCMASVRFCSEHGVLCEAAVRLPLTTAPTVAETALRRASLVILVNGTTFMQGRLEALLQGWTPDSYPLFFLDVRQPGWSMSV